MASPWPAIAQKYRVARRQRLAVLALAPVAWLAIGGAALLIVALHFRRYAPLLGQNHGPVSLVPLATLRQAARARALQDAIGIAARNAPFRSNCLPQALAAVLLCRLGGVPYAMHLGAMVDRDDPVPGLKAHAWVESGPVTITGGHNSHKRYGTVACYVRN